MFNVFKHLSLFHRATRTHRIHIVPINMRTRTRKFLYSRHRLCLRGARVRTRDQAGTCVWMRVAFFSLRHFFAVFLCLVHSRVWCIYCVLVLLFYAILYYGYTQCVSVLFEKLATCARRPVPDRSD